MSQFTALLATARPRQWIKNSIIFAGLIFSKHLFNLPDLFAVTEAFLIFCLVTSCIYIFNDLVDIKQDLNHPKKRLRPLPSGQLHPTVAKIALGFLLFLSLTLAYLLSYNYFVIVLFYFALMISYTLWLKNVVILDAFIIAAGFVLRGVAGMEVINVKMSPWFLICASLLALFIVFCKRRHELVILGDEAVTHRLILAEYKQVFLDQLISIVTSAIIVSYSLYTIAPETIVNFHSQNLIYTIPVIIFCLFRYLYLVYRKNEGGNAELLVFSDGTLFFSIGLWFVMILMIIYYHF